MAENKTPTETPAEESEFGLFSMTVERKPEGGVTVSQLPPALVKLLQEYAPKALADKDFELILTAKDKATAQKLALYARAWGNGQEPKLYIHKVPNRRDMKDNVARLAVELDSDVNPENRPGRRQAS